MKVSEIMTPDVHMANPDQTIREAAKTMAEIDAGALPVSENDRLIGMITDRDIAVRCVAEGRGLDAKVREVMTQEIKYCFGDQEVEEVAKNMAQQQLRRLPVIDRSKRLVGIVSLGDIAAGEGPDVSGDALRGISQPGGLHSQASR
ncbi:CBS domain-containing protein [Methylocystis sp.]|uniref:CBS domain-containing protein n=1 Tax=Methylocystis sp. TaxID=1911079 RepID=UPI003DA411FC